MARRTLDCLVPVFVGKAQPPPATRTGDDFGHRPPWVKKGIYPTNIPGRLGSKGQMASRERKRPQNLSCRTRSSAFGPPVCPSKGSTVATVLAFLSSWKAVMLLSGKSVDLGGRRII